MTRANLMLAASLGLMLPLPTPGQKPTADWIDVAQQIGGSGMAHDQRYVRLVPSRGFADEPTPPAWLELRWQEGKVVARGTIPVLRERAPSAVRVLDEELPDSAEILVRDTYGAASAQVHIRLLVAGEPVRIAIGLRRAFERIEPGALARIDATGIVEKDSFEGEQRLIVRTVEGERVDVGPLPPAVAHEGACVRLLAQRQTGRPGSFLYYGATGAWRTVATRDRVEALASARVPPGRLRGEAEWAAACRSHARSLLARDDLAGTRLHRPLASGFDSVTDPGFAVCPRCQRALAKDWLFADAGLDRVDAALRCCARDALYFLGRDGFDHGPFFPDLDPRKETR